MSQKTINSSQKKIFPSKSNLSLLSDKFKKKLKIGLEADKNRKSLIKGYSSQLNHKQLIANKLSYLNYKEVNPPLPCILNNKSTDPKHSLETVLPIPFKTMNLSPRNSNNEEIMTEFPKKSFLLKNSSFRFSIKNEDRIFKNTLLKKSSQKFKIHSKTCRIGDDESTIQSSAMSQKESKSKDILIRGQSFNDFYISLPPVNPTTLISHKNVKSQKFKKSKIISNPSKSTIKQINDNFENHLTKSSSSLIEEQSDSLTNNKLWISPEMDLRLITVRSKKKSQVNTYKEKNTIRRKALKKLPISVLSVISKYKDKAYWIDIIKKLLNENIYDIQDESLGYFVQKIDAVDFTKAVSLDAIETIEMKMRLDLIIEKRKFII